MGTKIVIQEMQRHRMGMISNFFAEPMGQPAGVGLIRRWSILNRSIRKRAHAPLDRGDVFLEVWRQFDLNIHGDRS
jgi:hypothetical protein